MEDVNCMEESWILQYFQHQPLYSSIQRFNSYKNVAISGRCFYCRVWKNLDKQFHKYCIKNAGLSHALHRMFHKIMKSRFSQGHLKFLSV